MLRAWREYAGFTLQGLVDALASLGVEADADSEDDESNASSKIGVKGTSTLSNWETGTRSPTPTKVRQLAKALGLDPDGQYAMFAMWRAAGSAAGIPARSYWEHNYQAEGGPVWLWLRYPPGAGPMSASGGWGPFGANFQVTADAGAIVHSPGSLSNPPVQVKLGTSGWVDFGNGRVPMGVMDRLGIESVEGASVFQGRFEDPPELTDSETKEVRFELDQMVAASKQINVMWAKFKGQMGAMRPSEKVQPLEGARTVQIEGHGKPRVDDRGDLVSQILLSPQQVKTIRRAGRSMSVATAVQEANDAYLARQDGYITSDHLRSLESSGRVPPIRNIITRLDRVYELDGYLGIERIVSPQTVRIDRRGTCQIKFPGYWVGPIWLQLRAPAGRDQQVAEGVLCLKWGYWRRFQQIKHGTIVTTRKAVTDLKPRSKRKPADPTVRPIDPFLEVRLPPGWSLAAGTGAVPGAIDINHDWYPANWPAAGRLTIEGFLTLRKAGRIPGLEEFTTQAKKTAGDSPQRGDREED